MAAGPRRRKAPARRAPAARRPGPAALEGESLTQGAAPGEGAGTPTPTPTPSPGAASFPLPPPAGGEGQGEGGTSPGAPTGPRPGRVVATASAASARLTDAERWIESALDGLEARLEQVALRAGIATAEGEIREVIARLLPAARARLATLGDLVRLIEPPERLDRHGMDPRFAERLAPVVDLLYSVWWRVEVRNIAAVPASGPALVVANHAGVVPWDAFVLRHALRRDHPGHRELRPLLDDRECALPVVGAAAIRAGAVRASPDAAERILAAGELVGIFPEGSAGARKPWRDRYRIQRFGRGGFVKVALRARAPIVPCAIVGSEEASPGISRAGWLAERLGMPLLAGTPVLRLPAAALLPLPSRWSLRFGAPVDTQAPGPAAADDPGIVNELTERVRSSIQEMLDEDLAARAAVFL